MIIQSRPFPVAQHWATALMDEWTAQADLEDHFCLQQSIKTSSDPLAGAESQIGFISAFVKPLLDLTVKAVPGSSMFSLMVSILILAYQRWLGTRNIVR